MSDVSVSSELRETGRVFLWFSPTEHRQACLRRLSLDFISTDLQSDSVTMMLVAQSTVIYWAEVEVQLCIFGVNQWLLYHEAGSVSLSACV